MIQRVVIYTGHHSTEVLGPYFHNIEKRVKMFEALNLFRGKAALQLWKIETVSGEELVENLRFRPFSETLLVIPAGQSTHLDQVFSAAQTRFLQDEFFAKGGFGYLNCGSAYWASETREYHDLCLAQPTEKKLIEKKSQIPLFDGKAIGPLCPFPALEYKVGFFSDAVDISYAQDKECTIFLSGGGYFVPRGGSDQKIQILARYKLDELERLGKDEACSIAALVAKKGKGAVLMMMFHPYYGPQDIDVERYEKAFPRSGTNWRDIHKRLSSEKTRVKYMHHILQKLQEFTE